MTDMDVPSEFVKSPVFKRGGKVHTGLAQPSSLWAQMLGLTGVAVLGAATFLSLSSSRQARSQPAPQVAVAAPVETAVPLPAVTRPEPPVSTPPRAETAPAMPESWRAPTMVIDFSERNGGSSLGASPAAGSAASAELSISAPVTGNSDNKLSGDELFATRVGSTGVDTAQATKLHDVTLIAPQGTVIPSVLETAINSDLPGFVRAVVSRDVHGFDGTIVLVPRGSKLFGQYRSGVAQNQKRAFVVWSRILTPNGVSINIGSPGVDRLGRSGLEGETDTHFFERFGGAILLSAITAGLDSLVDNSRTSIVIGSSQQASQVAGIALQKQIDIPATISVAQGTPLQVFVTRDLDFSGVVAAKP